MGVLYGDKVNLYLLVTDSKNYRSVVLSKTIKSVLTFSKKKSPASPTTFSPWILLHSIKFKDINLIYTKQPIYCQFLNILSVRVFFCSVSCFQSYNIYKK